MRVTIRTEEDRDVILGCLNRMDLAPTDYESRGSLLALDYSENLYREVAAWLASALACGLILSGGIER